eukprot:3857369-Lingulodinium_polyedra.AAC.1
MSRVQSACQRRESAKMDLDMVAKAATEAEERLVVARAGVDRATRQFGVAEGESRQAGGTV